MSWFTNFSAVNMSNPLFGDLQNDQFFGRAGFQVLTGKQIDILKGTVHTVFRGDFSIGTGEIIGGTMRSVTSAPNGTVAWTLTNLPSLSILEALDRASHLGNSANGNIGVNAYLFGDNDRLFDASTGASWFIGYAGSDSLYGNGGNDTLDGGAANDVMNGGAGNDKYFVDNASDVVNETELDGSDSGGTADEVNSSVSHTLGLNLENLNLTGAGNITGKGTNGVNTIIGNVGDNLIVGRGGADTMNGMAGDDTIEGGLGNDLIAGAGGSDTSTFYHSGQGVTVSLSLTGGQVTGAGNDTLTSIENLIGSQYDDALTGDDLDNVIEGGRGNDTIDGGAGRDTVSYAGAANGVTVDLNNNLTPQDTTGAGMDRLVRIENVLGSSFADTLTGSSAANVIDGGAGSDSLIGGGGVDNFYFSSQGGPDTIGDFGDGADKIVLKMDVFPLDEDGPGVVLPNEFYAAPGATSAQNGEQHLIYNTTTGALYYDRDGSGFSYGTVHIATVYSFGTTPAALSETDIIAG